MKILFVNEMCGYFGGVEQNVADSAAGLRVRGHQCYLAFGETTERRVTEYQEMFSGTYLCSELTPTSSSQGRRNLEQDPSQSFETILQEVAPDVVYFHKVA